MQLKWIIGIGIIAVAGWAVSMLNFGDSLVYFYTPAEARQKAPDLGRNTIKIGAMVKTGTVQWNPRDLDLAFVITDFKGNEIDVQHKGIKPDLFREGQGVVVEGRLSADGKNFTADRLMVKHSEEYKAPDDSHSIDKELLEKSIFKYQDGGPGGT